MRAFRLPTKLPKIKCSICNDIVPLVDGRLSHHLLTLGSQARKRTARLFARLWSLLESNEWTSCLCGGSTDSPEVLHIWSMRSKNSISVALALSPIRKESIPARPREKWSLASWPPLPNLNEPLLSKESMPGCDVPGLRDNVSGAPAFLNLRLPRYSLSAARHRSGRSQLELAFVNP